MLATEFKKIHDFDVYIASIEDADEVLQLIREAAQWVRGKHLKQWETVISGVADEEILNGIRNHETFLVRNNNTGELVATFTLYDFQNSWDKKLWGERDDNAAYLHKIAIRPTYTGSGLGKKIIDWIIRYLERKGKEIFRLDCIADNEKLNSFYREKCGLTQVGSNHGFNLYEKKLAAPF